ncbi:hypothetical protein [Okeania sp. SIO2B3]|uniref:hypothetical protein n=1 Tax=Okeania sp. SIO2B3 TaxID=2607784 RepID=UPI0013BF02BD|nr:hypothetical protein [Okeania sp. SIO2B3]NET45876.1 hypothetical protein [Okeania sp. SIO2B3]
MKVQYDNFFAVWFDFVYHVTKVRHYHILVQDILTPSVVKIALFSNICTKSGYAKILNRPDFAMIQKKDYIYITFTDHKGIRMYL